MFYFLAPILLIAGFLAYASTKPNTLKIHRESVINAAPDVIFPLLEDFHQWTRWSPWEDKDPQMKRVYSGAESGVGAIYEWFGDKNVGEGKMEILTADQNTLIILKLDFIKPFEGHNTTEFKLTPEGANTRLSWTMTGEANLMSKAMSTFIDMDKMIGKDFEKGLENLNRACQS
ncbi:MAG TPA: SRPBCC family protein [Oculatellaceae cyanobacterium]